MACLELGLPLVSKMNMIAWLRLAKLGLNKSQCSLNRQDQSGDFGPKCTAPHLETKHSMPAKHLIPTVKNGGGGVMIWPCSAAPGNWASCSY